MSVEIKMPALSPTMEVGTLSKWLVKEGDTVAAGDIIAEIETDKATMEVEAVEEGTVAKRLIAEGTEDVAVGKTIALLAEEGEDPDSIEAPKEEPAPEKPAPEEKPAEEKPKEEAKEAPKEKKEAPQGQAPKPAKPEPKKPAAKEEAKTTAPPAPETKEGERVFASPLARRLAKESGVDLTALEGSGPRGRIVKADVEKAVAEGVPAAAEAPAAAAGEAAPAPGAPERPHEAQRMSAMRKTIAKRMVESKQQVPHFYLTVEITLDPLLDLRKQLNARMEEEGTKLSVNDFLIKAVALSLMRVPDMNVQYGGDTLYRFKQADVSVAVALEGGLITPVIQDADKKGLLAISEEMKDLATRARDGKLAPEEYQGGNFSLSNLGMFGIKQFEAIINPPQAGILAVGAGEKRPVVKDDEVTVATMMDATLSCDHRAVDGAIGAQFLESVKTLIEDPLGILL